MTKVRTKKETKQINCTKLEYLGVKYLLFDENKMFRALSATLKLGLIFAILTSG
jgi:hypothetical protein